jgi:hypothetical protein
MIRKISALLAAFAFAVTTLAPVTAADARDRRGYHDRGNYRDYDHRRGRHHRDHDGDAVAAGAVGLILGLAIGSLASQPPRRGYDCTDNYQRCAPPPPRRDCYDPCRYDDSYYRQDPRDDRYYDDRGDSAYERDYGYEGGYDPALDDRNRREQCVRRERQWDRYANRYVTVDVPC